MTTIELAVCEARKNAEEMIFNIINGCITVEQKSNLDELLNSKVEKNKTRLAWLKVIHLNHLPK